MLLNFFLISTMYAAMLCNEDSCYKINVNDKCILINNDTSYLTITKDSIFFRDGKNLKKQDRKGFYGPWINAFESIIRNKNYRCIRMNGIKKCRITLDNNHSLIFHQINKNTYATEYVSFNQKKYQQWSITGNIKEDDFVCEGEQ